MFVAVIMAGGRGQRFWPLSTEDKPKQFLDLEGSGRTLIQSTLDRLLPLTGGVEHLFVITGERYRELVEDQLPELPRGNIILEPVGRDTAPAVALAALELQQRFGDVLMGLFTADHRVGNVPSFQGAVKRAVQVTEATRGLTTLGVKPTFPATGYGYIQAGAAVGVGFKVDRFVEKPDLRTAEAYLQDGGYFWNNGIFVWHTDTIVREFEVHAPGIIAPLTEALAADRVNEVFPEIEKISIDYAVLEKTDKAYMVAADYDWDDLGDWLAVERHLGKDETNTVVGAHVGLDSQGNVIYCDDESATIVTIGVEDMIIVKRGDTVLVTRKDRAQDIKSILQRPELAKKG